MTMKKAGGARTFNLDPNKDDHYIRHQNVNNIENLKEGDQALANVIEMGDEAVQNMNQANQDLKRQRELLNKFFFYDDELKVYIDRANAKVQYLERKVYIKKILLFILVVVLGLCAVTMLLLKMIN